MENNFSMDWGRGWFHDVSSALHLLCILFLLLLHQLYLRSSGIRSWRLGTLALGDQKDNGFDPRMQMPLSQGPGRCKQGGHHLVSASGSRRTLGPLLPDPPPETL